MTVRAYSVRNGIFGGERAYRLTPDALCWTESGTNDGRLAYADTRAMQLISYASPIGRALQCKLTSETGGRVLLRSAHYLSLGNFEDRTDSYRPFVCELTKRIDAANPKADFIAGSTGLWIMWIAVGLLWVGVIALLAAALFESIFDASLLGSFAVALGVCAACLPLLWREVRSGGRQRFDALAPPEELLGGTRAQSAKKASSSDR